MPGKIVSKEEYLTARTSLLKAEKEDQRNRDKLAKARTELPIVKLDKTYTFTAANGEKKDLKDLFEGRRQLIVYHFMFGPNESAGCHGCSFTADNLPSTLSHLHSRSTTLVFVSRAPIDKIVAFQKRMGWERFPWYSSNGSDFNYDFQVTIGTNEATGTKNTTNNYKEDNDEGERPGTSTFLMGDGKDGREEGVIYHTYSTYARGGETLLGTYQLLDMTSLGRMDDWPGESKMGWKLHDEYEEGKR